MTSATTPVSGQREPELAGQTVVVIGGSSGIGLETARRARTEAADVILAGSGASKTERPRSGHRGFRRHRHARPTGVRPASAAADTHRRTCWSVAGSYYASLADLDREQAYPGSARPTCC